MKKVYILERGQPQTNGGIFWHSKVAFKSRKDLYYYIEQSFTINKGWDKTEVQNEFDVKNNVSFISYKTKEDTQGREFTIFYKLSTLKFQYV